MTVVNRHKRTLIVNADDFGLSPEVNSGIVEAFVKGVVTDASVLIYAPTAPHGLALSLEKGLPVGIHVDFVTPYVEACNPGRKAFFGPQGLLTRELFSREFQKTITHAFTCAELIAFRDAIRSQVDAFTTLTGALPTHLDYHFGLHYLPEIMAMYVLVANDYGLPVRWGEQYAGRNPYRKAPRVFSDGFHENNASFEKFVSLLEIEWDGTQEICCHPGYFTPGGVLDSYNQERERELGVLIDARLKDEIAKRDITLVNFTWLRENTEAGFSL